MEKIKNLDSIAESGKIEFFRKLAFRHLPEMRLLIGSGKLSKKDGWRNVAEHCLVQVAISEKMAELIGLSKEETEKLVRVAACHDWAKRINIKPGEFSEEEKEEAYELLRKLNPDKGLMDATGPGFLEKALVRKESSFLERLQFYIDDITKGSEIVAFDERVNEVEARRQDLNENAELTARLGGRYWDKERQLGHQVEGEVFALLKEKNAPIDSPQEIPSFLLKSIESEINGGRNP